MVDIAVLLSVGSHPASGRARRAPLDAQALELALRLTEAGHATRIHALHAGNPSEPALRDYLGMGLDRLEVLETAPGADPVPALTARLRELSPALILAGAVAEGGEDSGMVPYLIAQALNRTLVPDIVGIDFTDAEAALTQALPRGQRRLVTAPPPLVATLHSSAHAARQSAFARARRGTIEARPATVQPRRVPGRMHRPPVAPPAKADACSARRIGARSHEGGDRNQDRAGTTDGPADTRRSSRRHLRLLWSNRE